MADFEVLRQTTVAAEPARVRALIDDFRRWRSWSPWEDADPNLARTYTGPESGVGAHYTWRGNRKAGAGSMEILTETDREIGIRLSFEKPFAAVNSVTFTLDPVPQGSRVSWRMTGTRGGLFGLVGRVLPMDRLIGKDFERGLARLKSVAESPSA
ncbi:SRPBCC family protein [Nocardia thailandica]